MKKTTVYLLLIIATLTITSCASTLSGYNSFNTTTEAFPSLRQH